MRKIVLASASPRRKMLLEMIGLKFDIMVPVGDEIVDTKLKSLEVAEEISYMKAVEIRDRISKDDIYSKKGSIIISADTIVILHSRILGKPKNEEQAYDMLSKLSGEIHSVITGYTIMDTLSSKIVKKHQETNVKMAIISDDKIKSYILSKEPMDKAGSYGIQGIGAQFIERIEGCYYNVVGLPINCIVNSLEQFGVKLL